MNDIASPMQPGKIAIVIVNYRTADLATECLRSLSGEIRHLPEAVAIVVDNCSADGSTTRIRDAFAAEGWRWVSLLARDSNDGFAAGNNAALRLLFDTKTQPDYVLLLNPDTIVRPGAIRALLDFMATHPDVGVAGSRLERADGTVARSAFRFPTLVSEFDLRLRLGVLSRLLRKWVIYGLPASVDEPIRADWVSGASMLIRREVFQSIGFLDEGYFLFFEEVDFCFRAARAGWTCWHVPQSRVVHLEGQSTGICLEAPQRSLPESWFNSRRRYFIKNHGPMYAAAVDLAWFLGHALWRVRRFLERKADIDPPRFFRDYVRSSVFVRGFKL